MEPVEKYYNEKGQVAVLYSPGYGSGWSTWGPRDGGKMSKEWMIFDKGLVQLVLNKASQAKAVAYINSVFGEIYTGLYIEELRIQWMEPGAQFEITEYDGFESIEFYYGKKWNQA